MKTKECPSCAMNIPAESKVCPICSYEFTEGYPTSYKWLAVLLILAFVLAIIYGLRLY